MKKAHCRAVAAVLLLGLFPVLPAFAAGVPVEDPAPWETVVRIHTDHGDGSGSIGSGTIILSDETRTIVLTASHVIDESGTLTVDVFDGKLVGDVKRPKVSPLGSYPAKAIAFDRGTDVGLLEFRPGVVLAASPIVAEDYEPAIGEKMTAVGCSGGQDATPWTTYVEGFSVDTSTGYRGIECHYRPAGGRSGGGLFTVAWEVAGVCNFAEVEHPVGLYAEPKSIHGLLKKVLPTGLFSGRGGYCPNGNCPSAQSPQPQRQQPPAPDAGLMDSFRRRFGEPETPPPSPPATSPGGSTVPPATPPAAGGGVTAEVEVALFGVAALVAIGFAVYQSTSRKRVAT